MGGDENEEKRNRVKQEILATERSYVADISTVIDVFMKPLLKNAEDATQAVVTRNDVVTLFSNLESILCFNQQLLMALEEEQSGQSNIGQIFIEMAPYLRMYCIYVNGHSRATELHQTLLERNVKKDGIAPYAQFLAECAEKAPERVRNRQLTDLLIMPVQRVPRYRLLLEELLKRSPPGDEYDTLEMGLAKIADVANLVNERLRDYENRMKVLKIQKRFGNAVPLVEPHRKFVMEGTLQKMCRKGPRDYVFVLFSDLLVYGVPTTTLASIAATDEDFEQPVAFKRQIDLATSSLTSVSDTSFQISSPTKSFVVIAPDSATKNTWYSEIEQYLLSCAARAAETDGGALHSPATTVSSTMTGDDQHAPLWVPDKDAPNCQLPDCRIKFTLLTRRHHCRSCGLVVCAECSPHRWHLPNIDKAKPQRICNQCYLEIRHKLEEDNFESAGSLNMPRPAPPPSNKSASSSSATPASSLLKVTTGLLSRLSWSASGGSPSPKTTTSSAAQTTVEKKSTTATTAFGSSTPVSSAASSPAGQRKSEPASSSEDIPRNWRALKDEHGKTYYWHVITDMVTYERPTGKVKTFAASPSNQESPPSRPSSSALTPAKPTTTTAISSSSPLRASSTSGSSKSIPQSNKYSLTVDTKQQQQASSPPSGSATVFNKALGPTSSNNLLPPGSPLNSISSGSIPTRKPIGTVVASSSSVPVNAAANLQHRRPSVKGPSLAERLASLSEQGVFGDPKTARFQVKQTSNSSRPKSQFGERESSSSGSALVRSGNNFSSSPLVSPKAASASTALRPSSAPTSKLPSPRSASSLSPSRSPGSSNMNQTTSTTRSPDRPTTSGTLVGAAGGGGSKFAQQYSNTLTSTSASKPVELSQLNDAEFFRLMGVFRTEFEKLSHSKKSELKRAKNAV